MHILSPLLDLLFPPHCILCNKIIQHGDICPACEDMVQWLGDAYWAAHLMRPHFDSVTSLAAYDGPWMETIHRFKYNGKTYLARPFARIAISRLSVIASRKKYDLVVPTPLHKNRLKRRGFNQSLLLARNIAGLLKVGCAWDLLLKTVPSPPQVGLTQSQRLQNVGGTFACSGPALSSRILLVDDVMTTGATVNECAKALKSAGALSVDVLTLARTL